MDNDYIESTELLTQEKIKNWEQYLQWNKCLLKSRTFGCRYIDLKLDADSGMLIIKLVYPSKEQFNKTRFKLNSDELDIYDLSCSDDEWIFKMNKSFDNFRSRRNIRKYEIGSFVKVNNKELKDKKYLVETVYELPDEYQKEYDNIDWNGNPKSMNDFRDLEREIKNYYPESGFLAESAVASLVLNNRLERTVKNFKRGIDCCSPYLSSWLFDIKQARLPEKENPICVTKWLNPDIEKNENQKQAVIKMLNAPDVCLIQGPPGTGKTTVIAEAIYQFTSHGKRVLISSQSNDAVDNALERLKNSPDIRAIRLERSKKNKDDVDESKFNEDTALEFFYQSLYKCISDEWKADSIEKKIEYISKCDSDIEKLNNISNKIELEKDKYKKQTVETSQGDLIVQNSILQKFLLSLNSTYNSIWNNRFIKELDEVTIRKFCHYLNPILEYSFDKGIGLLPSNAKCINENSSSVLLRGQLTFFGDRLIKLIKIFNKLKDTLSSNTNGLSCTKYIQLDNGEDGCFIQSIPDKYDKDEKLLYCTQDTLMYLYKNILNKYGVIAKIEEKTEIKSNESILNKYEDRIKLISNDYVAQQNDACLDVSEIQEIIKNEKYKKEQQIEQYAFWKDLIDKFCKRLTDKNLFKVDKEYYQDKYVNACNVVGASCTSRMNGPNETKYKNFDVVIIDEVSKATPPELLNPLMKAQKAILVGDHRQLPPIFKEHEKSYTEMVEIIKSNEDNNGELDINNDSDILTIENFNKFKNMVTASLFKEYFEQADDSIKHSLLVQYRMHSDIMNVINRFYENKLTAGLSQKEENIQKRHGLTINGVDNTPFICPEYHAYWIDSSVLPSGKDFYENFKNNSTSATNILEQYIIIELLKKMAEEYTNKGYGKNKKKTIGVISFYLQQVRDIRKLCQKERSKNSNFKALDITVNTVDRFQGQEKNIIICSLVRNNQKGRASGHVVAFERINVAFSRAQELLVIVGAKHLYQNVIVTLPYMDNEGEYQEPVYKNIMERLNHEGMFVPSNKIITSKIEAEIIKKTGKRSDN